MLTLCRFQQGRTQIHCVLAVHGQLTWHFLSWQVVLCSSAPFCCPNGAPKWAAGVSSPALIPLVARAVADRKGIGIADVLEASLANARKLFGVQTSDGDAKPAPTAQADHVVDEPGDAPPGS